MCVEVNKKSNETKKLEGEDFRIYKNILKKNVQHIFFCLFSKAREDL